MTNLINQININGQATTFLNYVNPLVSGVISPGSSRGVSYIADLLTTHFGAAGGNWNYRTAYSDYYSIRFPVPWETLSGSVSANTVSLANNARFMMPLTFDSSAGGLTFLNTSNTTANYKSGYYRSADDRNMRPYVFGCINNYSMVVAGFNDASRTSCLWSYAGWARNPQYSTSGTEFPRNALFIDTLTGRWRVTQENTTTAPTALAASSPVLSCSIATPGADSSEVILQDAASPNNYIGQLWNMMRLPSSAVVGKIYKNTGIDPDTGVVETDQKAFWMCVGSWGTDKIGMRVWTEDIT